MAAPGNGTRWRAKPRGRGVAKAVMAGLVPGIHVLGHENQNPGFNRVLLMRILALFVGQDAKQQNSSIYPGTTN
jgi:hypothetical protein